MYQDVKNLVPRGHKKIANNTYLTYIPESSYGEYVDMVLHGNTVARFYPTHIQLYSAGWYTTTTKNRLNLALELARVNPTLHWYRIFQIDCQWYYGNCRSKDTKFYDGICIDYSGKVMEVSNV